MTMVQYIYYIQNVNSKWFSNVWDDLHILIDIKIM